MNLYLRTRHLPRALWVIVFVHVALSFLYARLTPIFEAPDEHAHTQYAAFYATNSHLPDTRAELVTAGIESTQGPLYYVISGLFLRAAGAPPLDVDRRRNPKFDQPDPNLFIPELLPSDCAIRLVRLVSTLGGVLAILATFALGQALCLTRTTSLCGAAFVAFLPQFVFIASSISNDSWAAAGGAAVLAAIISADQRSALSARHVLALGVITGLVALIKASLLILVPIGGLVVLLHSHRLFAKTVLLSTVYGMGVVLGGGWFFLRNLWFYGSWLNWDALQMIGANQMLNQEMRTEYLLQRFPQMTMRSFVGVFGQVNVFMPELCYQAFTLAWLCAFVGLWLWLWQNRRAPRREWLWLLAICGLNLSTLIAWNTTFLAHQGRLLFPALGAIAVLLAKGWSIYPGRVGQGIRTGVVAGLLVLNNIGLWIIATIY